MGEVVYYRDKYRRCVALLAWSSNNRVHRTFSDVALYARRRWIAAIRKEACRGA